MKRTLSYVLLLSALSFVGSSFAAIPGYAVDTSYSGNGTISFEGEYPQKPIDPEKPEIPVDPGPSPTVGNNLRLDFVPALDFGNNKISSTDERYSAKAQLFHDETEARGNYVQVTDIRGTAGGWTLQLKQEAQFQNPTDRNLELNGAMLSLDKSWANSVQSQTNAPKVQTEVIEITPGVAYDLAVAEQGKGEGTWVISFGASETNSNNVANTLIPQLDAQGNQIIDTSFQKPSFLNQAVTLAIPGKTEKKPVHYQTVLTWTLSELP